MKEVDKLREEADNSWDIIITPKRKWYELNLREVVRYKDLIGLFVKRSFNAQYKQTILGPLWYIINPVLTAVVSTVIFGNIAHIRSDGVPYFLFYLVGYTLWSYFASCVTATSTTFTSNAEIMGKVYFPRLTMPISAVIYAAINMIIIFFLSVIAMIIYSCRGVVLHFGINVLTIPILMLQTAILGLSVGIIISALTTKYRDLAILVSFGLSLWMYITPVVYPISAVGGNLKILLMLNPMSAIVSNYRYAMLGSGEYESTYWLISIGITFCLFLFGVMIFNKVEKTFMDTV